MAYGIGVIRFASNRFFATYENPISATEYDFVPNRLEVNTQTLVHFQWAGSNTNDKVNYRRLSLPGRPCATPDANSDDAIL